MTGAAPVRVLVTGGTSGIGAACVAELAARPGVEVLVHGRDPARGARLVADLTLRADVERLAREAGPVDVLVNNAGAVFGTHARTPDGHERTWALNHLAPFLLTRALAPPRVVTVSSAAHRRARIHWEDPDALTGWPAYGQSKLANVLFTRALAARGVRAFALDPGVVATRFAHDLDDERLKARLTGQRRSDPALPGGTLARLALGELDPDPGAYVGPAGGAGRLGAAARSDEAAQRLHALSERVTAAA